MANCHHKRKYTKENYKRKKKEKKKKKGNKILRARTWLEDEGLLSCSVERQEQLWPWG